jgi:hypothetical protein
MERGARLLLVVGALWAVWVAAVVGVEARQALTAAREVPVYETARSGDFDGDGRADLITFTRDKPEATGQVYVALSDGSQFVNRHGRPGRGTLWHSWFAISASEQVLIGDFDGDGKDDMASWLGSTTRQVYVALSTGKRMGEAKVWAEGFGFDASDVLVAGDVNGDGRADVICFSPVAGRIAISLSSGTSFEPPAVEWFRMH